jgi:complement component 1 Q subcomponent-binding protein
MFSIADISNPQQEAFEDLEGEEGAEAAEEEDDQSYPIRCSFSITKV